MTVDRITLKQLPDGDAGTRATLKEMGDLVRRYKVDPLIYTLSRQLTAHLPQKDWPGQVRALTEYVRDRIRYVHDPSGLQALQLPPITLELGAGNCAQKSTLLGALLASIGHPVQFAAARELNDEKYGHVFVRTLIGRSWVPLETTEPVEPGTLGPGAQRITQPLLIYTVR